MGGRGSAIVGYRLGTPRRKERRTGTVRGVDDLRAQLGDHVQCVTGEVLTCPVIGARCERGHGIGARHHVTRPLVGIGAELLVEERECGGHDVPAHVAQHAAPTGEVEVGPGEAELCTANIGGWVEHELGRDVVDGGCRGQGQVVRLHGAPLVRFRRGGPLALRDGLCDGANLPESTRRRLGWDATQPGVAGAASASAAHWVTVSISGRALGSIPAAANASGGTSSAKRPPEHLAALTEPGSHQFEQPDRVGGDQRVCHRDAG